jgi:hypothetical protein
LRREQASIDSLNRRAAAKEANVEAAQASLGHARQDVAGDERSDGAAPPSASARTDGAPIASAQPQAPPPAQQPIALASASAPATSAKAVPNELQLERDCNLRAQPSPSSSVIQSVLKGSRVAVESASGNWVKASLDEGGTTGFIAKMCFR